MRRCPKCNSRDFHGSRRRGLWETWRQQITGKRPFRCHACNWRGWRQDDAPDVVWSSDGLEQLGGDHRRPVELNLENLDF
jgi:hypothetical protein